MPRPLQHSHCTVEGCGRPHKAHGYCAGHYQQFKRGEGIRDLQKRVYDHDPICTVEGCELPQRSNGLCNMHYLRAYKHGATDFRYREGGGA